MFLFQWQLFRREQAPTDNALAMRSNDILIGRLKEAGVDQDAFVGKTNDIIKMKSHDQLRGIYYLKDLVDFDLSPLSTQKDFNLFNAFLYSFTKQNPDKSREDLISRSFLATKYIKNLDTKKLKEGGIECVTKFCTLAELYLTGVPIGEIEAFMKMDDAGQKQYYDSKFGQGAYDKMDVAVKAGWLTYARIYEPSLLKEAKGYLAHPSADVLRLVALNEQRMMQRIREETARLIEEEQKKP